MLLDWCSTNGIKIDSNIALVDTIRSSDSEAAIQGIAVMSKSSISPLTTLVQIPKSAILSVRSCRLSSALDSLSDQMEEQQSMALALALLIEIKSGGLSRWHGYMQSLPPSTVQIAALWEMEGGCDGGHALRWCKGTEVEKILVREHIENSLTEFWTNAAQPLLSTANIQAEYGDMRYAYSLVSSRAFYVDAYHGISMVPIADAFNHIEENQIHLETDYDVCSTCGSLDVCEHDEEEPIEGSNQGQKGTLKPRTSQAQHRFTDDSDMCEMVTNAPIKFGDEVFNCYDSGLPNAQLLCHYGFLLEGNSNDLVTWSLDEIIPIPLARHQHAELLSIVRACVHQLLSHKLDILYNPPVPTSSTGKPVELVFGVNAEGTLSTHLFSLLLVASVMRQQDVWDVDSITRLCTNIVLIIQEVGYSVDERGGHNDMVVEDSAPPNIAHAPNALPFLRRICTAVQNLCADKIIGIGLNATEADEKDWGDILDVEYSTLGQQNEDGDHQSSVETILKEIGRHPGLKL
ncbi:hypothetical protein FRB98_006774 [Tulasnella sp. 332]|nr:hypothetical protein FRB98_006774 [Tulasnella sp. 332]